MITHVLKVGATGSGKSEDELSDLVNAAMEKKSAIVVEDPPGRLATQLLLHLAERRQLHRVIYDRLSDTDLVPIYEWLTPSTNQDPFQRYAENDDRIRKFIALLIRRGGLKDTAGTPLIEKGLLDALRLFIYQKNPVPLHWLARLYTPMSPEFFAMTKNCVDEDAILQMKRYAAMNPSQRNAETGPADRRLRAVMMSPIFQVRCGEPSFDFDAFMQEKGILILDGYGANPDAASVMMSAITLKVIDFCKRKRKFPVQITMDEAINAGLIGLQESQALAEVRKWSLRFNILVQAVNFASDEVRDNILQNCSDHRWFRQGSPDAADLAARDIATPILDPMKVHHTEYRTRTVEDGFEEIKTRSHSHTKDKLGKTTSKTASDNSSFRRRTKEVQDAQDRYTSLSDQVALVQKDLMRLEPGWRFEKGDTIPTYRPMEADLCQRLASGLFGGTIRQEALEHLKESKLQKAIEHIKSSGAYRKPLLTQPPSQPTPPSQAKSVAERMKERHGTK